MIKILNMSKKFDDKVIFSNLNITFEKPELVAIIGKSGSGKSTLLNIIGLLEDYDEGKLIIYKYLGPKLNRSGGRKLLQNDIGFIFQSFALIENLTVRENLKLVSKYNNSTISFEEALNRTDTLDLIDKKVRVLSGGEQQRVAISRLLLKNPNIILADEPTGSLDTKNRDIIMNLLREFVDQEKLVIIVTHDMEIAKMCDRIIDLDGEIK